MILNTWQKASEIIGKLLGANVVLTKKSISFVYRNKGVPTCWVSSSISTLPQSALRHNSS